MKVKTLFVACLFLCSMSMMGQQVAPNEKVQEALDLGLLMANGEDMEFCNYRTVRSFDLVRYNAAGEIKNLSEIKHKISQEPLSYEDVLLEDFNILLYEIEEDEGPVTLFKIEGTDLMMRFFNTSVQYQMYERSQVNNSK